MIFLSIMIACLEQENSFIGYFFMVTEKEKN